MRRALAIGLTMFLGAAAGLAGREARACSPWDPSLDRTFPPAGEALPHGAALLLDGHVLMPDELAVTVDGQPAELVLLPEHSVAFDHFGWGLAYRTMAKWSKATLCSGSS